MTNIDFHIHSKKTSKANFEINDFINVINQVKKERLDCIAITEHAHAKNYSEAYDFLKNNYKYDFDHYIVDDIKVFVGVEVSVSEGFDIVCIDQRDNIKQIQKSCPNLRGELSLSDLFEKITNEALIILAHPYRKHKDIVIKDNILERIDAIEINANEINRKDNKVCNSKEEQILYIKNCFILHKTKIENLGFILNKPVISGSDSHNYIRVGYLKTILFEKANTLQQIKKQIQLKNLDVELSNNI